VAEATKLLENIFRSVNIALVNELKVVYAAMGIDVWEVISAAKTKPFGFMAFYPGPGPGRALHSRLIRFISLGRRANSARTRGSSSWPAKSTPPCRATSSRARRRAQRRQETVNGSKVLILGLAYKANVDDDRESPSYVLMDLFQGQGAKVAYYDPHVPVIRHTREHPHWAGTKSVDARGASGLRRGGHCHRPCRGELPRAGAMV
jgi:UDP-N-acetyl-D-glucosamine dehydrogenase